jgi:hypothetical protein
MVTWPANNTAAAAFSVGAENTFLAVWRPREPSDLERRHITLEKAPDGLVAPADYGAAASIIVCERL